MLNSPFIVNPSHGICPILMHQKLTVLDNFFVRIFYIERDMCKAHQLINFGKKLSKNWYFVLMMKKNIGTMIGQADKNFVHIMKIPAKLELVLCHL